MLTKGWDLIYTEPNGDKEDVYQCKVCGKEMKVQRNKKTVTGWAHGMACSHGCSEKVLKDIFTCSDHEEGWHKQAKQLKILSQKTHSKYLSDIYEKEIEEILMTKKETKKGTDLYL